MFQCCAPPVKPTGRNGEGGTEFVVKGKGADGIQPKGADAAQPKGTDAVQPVLEFSFACGRKPHAKLNRNTPRTPYDGGSPTRP